MRSRWSARKSWPLRCTAICRVCRTGSITSVERLKRYSAVPVSPRGTARRFWIGIRRRARSVSVGRAKTRSVVPAQASAHRRARFALPALRKELVFRPRQTQILAQRLAFVFAPEDAASLQLRHDAGAKIFQAARQIRKHDDESVTGVGFEPLLHLVGD